MKNTNLRQILETIGRAISEVISVLFILWGIMLTKGMVLQLYDIILFDINTSSIGFLLYTIFAFIGLTFIVGGSIVVHKSYIKDSVSRLGLFLLISAISAFLYIQFFIF